MLMYVSVTYAYMCCFFSFFIHMVLITCMQSIIPASHKDALMSFVLRQILLYLLGNVVGDIQHLIRNLLWVRIDYVRRGVNQVAHVLAQFARNITKGMFWMEDVPPIAREVLYQDANFVE